MPGAGHSSFRGLRKWTIDAEKYFDCRAAPNRDRAIRTRARPYDRDFSRWTARP